MNILVQMGSVGEAPKAEDYARTRNDKPNTMDVCTWYLAKTKEEGWPRLDDEEMIERVRDPSFIAELKGDDKPIDTLSMTLGATFLHEVY